jgi:toxin CcdB
VARFDVYRHPLAKVRKRVPYLLSIQADALDFLETRIVVPLVTEKAFGPRIPFLHPIVDLEQTNVVIAMNELTALERALLGSPVANLHAHASEIVGALDYLISGY